MLFLAFYTSGHLINATLMDSVHWLFHLVHDLMGAFKNLSISQFYLYFLTCNKKLTSDFLTLLLLIA